MRGGPVGNRYPTRRIAPNRRRVRKQFPPEWGEKTPRRSMGEDREEEEGPCRDGCADSPADDAGVPEACLFGQDGDRAQHQPQLDRQLGPVEPVALVMGASALLEHGLGFFLFFSGRVMFLLGFRAELLRLLTVLGQV